MSNLSAGGLELAPLPTPRRRWRFTQLTNASPITIDLQGPSAPYGRPRHGEIVADGIEQRETAYYYPGNPKPTRHTFGEKHDDIVLHGRWMDADLGTAGAANALVQQFKALVRDQLPIKIEWGEVICATGLPKRFLPKRESDAEVVWEFTIRTDSDDALPPKQVALARPRTSDYVASIADFNPTPSIPADLPLAYPSSFLDTIDGYVSQVNAATATVLNLANQIDDFSKASAAELTRLLGGIGQLQTAYLTLADALDDGTLDVAVGGATANTQTSFALSRAQQRADLLFQLALLAAMSDDVKTVLAGKPDTTVRAFDGDTWESLSQRLYGSIDHADALRQANGVTGGKRPRGGRIVHVPRQ